MFQTLGLLGVGYLLGNKEARVFLEQTLTPIINNAVKPMVQSAINNLNGKDNVSQSTK